MQKFCVFMLKCCVCKKSFQRRHWQMHALARVEWLRKGGWAAPEQGPSYVKSSTSPTVPLSSPKFTSKSFDHFYDWCVIPLELSQACCRLRLGVLHLQSLAAHQRSSLHLCFLDWSGQIKNFYFPFVNIFVKFLEINSSKFTKLKCPPRYQLDFIHFILLSSP